MVSEKIKRVVNPLKAAIPTLIKSLSEGVGEGLGKAIAAKL
jgi:hypothetical protein